MPSETDAAADLVICADLHCCHGRQLLLQVVAAASTCSACSVSFEAKLDKASLAAAAGQYVANLQIVYPFPYTTLGALLSHLYRATSSIQICSAAQAACCFASTFMPEMHKRVTTQRPLGPATACNNIAKYSNLAFAGLLTTRGWQVPSCHCRSFAEALLVLYQYCKSWARLLVRLKCVFRLELHCSIAWPV